jgi:hypothetical protein
MAQDPVEILNRRNAEVTRIRGFADLTDEAKERRIAEVSERAQAEYAEALETAERERAERLKKTEAAVFRVPVSPHVTDAEEAQIHAAFRSAWGDVYSSTLSPESPQQAQEELERLLQQAERTGDKLLARAAFHRAVDLGVQSVVDTYLASRPQENRAWESYTASYAEAGQSRDVMHLLGRNMTERALSGALGSGANGR